MKLFFLEADVRISSYVTSLIVRAPSSSLGSKRRGVAVPSDSSTPAGKAGVLMGSVRMEEGVVDLLSLTSKSTSRFLSH